MLRWILIIVMLAGLLVACGEGVSSVRGSSQRCSGSAAAYSCTGSINQLTGSPTVSMGSGSLAFSEFSVVIVVTVEEGTVLVSFTDEDGETVQTTASPGSPAELDGDPMTFDGEMTLTLAAQGEDRTASGIDYTAEFTR